MNLLDIFFPKCCVGCNKTGIYFCSNCIQGIKQTDLVCPFCERLSLGGVVHPICIRKYGLDGLWSLGVYEDPLKKAVQKLKYKFIIELAEVLIDITLEYWAKYQPFLLDQIKKNKGEGWVITAVPLHKNRQNLRGFNQSSLLGRLLAKKTGLNYQELLVRVKNTKQQAKLPSHLRKQNIKNAFILATNDLRSATSVILVDDVWTTGSTLKECCLVLKKGGAKKVWGLTLAR